MANEEVDPSVEIGLGSRVQISIPPGVFVAGMTRDGEGGLAGVVVGNYHDQEDDFIVRLDDQSGNHGWRGRDERGGDPDDPNAFCLHVPVSNLILLDGGVKSTPPEPDPEVLEFKKKIYEKAVNLVRTDYAGYEHRVQEWLGELNMAPRSATYRVAGELKYDGTGWTGVPTLEAIRRRRLSEVPDLKMEVVDIVFPRQRPGETVESLTANAFALVERVIANNTVCESARVFIRKLGLRPPPRKKVEVKLNLKLNAAELAQLTANPAALLAMVRAREFDTRNVSEVKVTPPATRAKRAPRAKAPEPEVVNELATAL